MKLKMDLNEETVEKEDRDGKRTSLYKRIKPQKTKKDLRNVEGQIEFSFEKKKRAWLRKE